MNHFRFIRAGLLAPLLACTTLLFIGCAGGGVAGSDGTGTLAVRMSDGSGSGITSAIVTVTKIDAHIGSSWQTVFTGTHTVDLLDLRNNDMLLGSALVPAGQYTQVRMYVSSATVTDGNGTHNVTIPSGVQTGIKLNLNYTVDPNVLTAILLDFNVGRSFVLQGNGTYRLQPVIPVVVQVLSGTATGIVSNALGVAPGASVTATYTGGASYPIGTEVNSTTTQADGVFKVWALLPGTYTFTFSYINPNTSATETATVTDVSITANQNTDMGPIIVL